MFYNLGFAGRAMRRMGAIEFVTTIAPGLRDVILTGKIKECAVRTDKSGRRVYDEIVVDAPPTGRIAGFLDVTKAMADVAKGGPIAAQAEGVAALLHSEQTVVHLVTLLEAPAGAGDLGRDRRADRIGFPDRHGHRQPRHRGLSPRAGARPRRER